MKKIVLALTCLLAITVASAKSVKVEPSYAWRLAEPLGERITSTIDTLYTNYAQTNIPSMQSDAYATTGNLGAEGETLIYFDRKPTSDFFFTDALRAWLPSFDKVRFYNTRIPMTLASYNFGGGKYTTQDRLKTDFSGNINSRAQVGAMLDYLYSKGSYDYQAVKNLSWGFSGSYIGDKYQFQGFYYHYNSVNKENGGITDDLYITDPAEIQGGSTSIDTKNIPTNLTGSFSRVLGGQLYLNNRYNLGHYVNVEQGDSTVRRFVPVSSVVWTLDFKNAKHTFHNSNATQDHTFWDDTYLTYGATHDVTSYWSIRNTVGMSLLEGFNKYAQAGLSVFLTHEYRKFTQTTDTIDRTLPLPDGINELPITFVPTGKSQNLAWVGARLTRQQGKVLNYEATAEIGFVGEAAGEFKADGNITTHFNIARDSLSLRAYGSFHNTAVPYLLNHYISNHFAWDNDFGKTRSLRFGGELNSPRTMTTINVGVENVQNLVYFNADCLPTQCGSSVQVFTARLSQNFRVGILGWDNRITYQTSSNTDVIPLPKLAIYSNLYIKFKVAHVLDVQFGLDCDYYTKYRAVAYQPATMAFYNQNEVECGNYPFMNLYANMKLSKVRFYVMFSHVNQGLTGSNYFSMPHYPLNPRRFQLGFSVDFAN